MSLHLFVQFAGTRSPWCGLLEGEMPVVRGGCPQSFGNDGHKIICLKMKQMQSSKKGLDAVSDDIRNCEASESKLVLRSCP